MNDRMRMTKPNDIAPKPRTWWQWLLVYPAVLTVLAGALPTLSNAVQSWFIMATPVPLNKVDEAKEQLALLKANLPCTQEAAKNPMRSYNSILIGAKVCDSGDVVIVSQNASLGQFPNPVIVPWKRIVSLGYGEQLSMLSHLSPFSSAYAQAAGQAAEGPGWRLICQRLDDHGNLLRRFKTPGGECADILSNVLSRKILRQTPAPCDPRC